MKTLVSVITPSYLVELGRLVTDQVELEGDWTGRFANSHDANLKACGVLKVALAIDEAYIEAISKTDTTPLLASNEPVAEVVSAIKEDEEPVVIETSEGTPVEVVADAPVESAKKKK
jgi:hypothetical protein